MIALIRYVAADLVRSQRSLPPVMVFLTVLAIVNTQNPGPLLPAFGSTATVLCAVAAWLTITVMNSEDPTSRTITAVTCGSYRRLVWARVSTCLIVMVALAVVAVAWTMEVSSHDRTAAAFATGVVGHLICAAVGLSIGLLCSQPVINHLASALCAALVPVVVVLIVPWVSPVHPTLRLLLNANTPNRGLAVDLAGLGAATAAFLVVAVWLATQLGRRLQR